jgi:hypothetical protein
MHSPQGMKVNIDMPIYLLTNIKNKSKIYDPQATNVFWWVREISLKAQSAIKYTGSIQEWQLRRRGKQYKKIIITNHYRGKERSRPRVQRIKEKINELLNSSFFVLELSIVAFPPTNVKSKT